MSSPITIKLNSGKPFPMGEIPFPLNYTFKNSSNTALPLTGFTAEVFIEGPDEDTDYAQGSLTFNDGTATATYTWDGAEFSEEGTYSMIIWVGDGTNRFGSDKIVWTVYDGPGAAPSV